MHEYGIVQSLLDSVAREAAARDAAAVRRVEIRIGEVSGVEPELLATAFEILRPDTICAGARLDIVHVPARWICTSCARPIEAGGMLRCPECGAPARLESGAELFLDRIELEVPDV